MGWGIPIVDDIVDAVDNAFKGLTHEAQVFSDNVRREITNASRGDLGHYVAKTGTQLYRTAATPLEVASDVTRGDIQAAGKHIGQGAGSALNISTGPAGYVAQTSSGQKILDNKDVDKYTLGLSGDYAGTQRGVDELYTRGSASRENIDDAARLGAKLYGGYAAASLYSEYTTASAVGGSAVPGYGSAVASGAGYAKDAALGLGAAKSLIKGDVQGAVNQARQISGDYSDYLPQLPTGPSAPDWFPDLGNLWDEYFGSKNNTPAPQVSNPWNFTGNADSGISKATTSSAMPLVLGVGLVIGTAILLKRKR